MSGFEKVMVQFRLKYPMEAVLIDSKNYYHPLYDEVYNLWVAFRDGYIAGRKSILPPEQQIFLEKIERMGK